MRNGVLAAAMVLVGGPVLAASSTDLVITLDCNDTTQVHAGQKLGFTLMASNAGPADAKGARLRASFPETMAGVTWTCESSSGTSCPTGGNGDVDLTLDLPVGSAVVITGVGTTLGAGVATATASVAAGSGQGDVDPKNNSAALATEVAAPLPPAPDAGTSASAGEAPAESGGCSVAGRGSPLAALLLALGLVALRKR